MERVFVTGASGCVGGETVRALLAEPGYEVHLLVRDPAKLPGAWLGHDRVKLVVGDFLDIERFASTLRTMDHVVHVAAAWGEAEAYDVNHRLAHRLFELADPERCRQMILFSTASVLDRDHRPLQAADEHGTDYIRSKFLGFVGLEDHPLRDRISVLFPTLVVGRGSHVGSALATLARGWPLVAAVTVDASFHFMHARDIARIVVHRLKHGVPGERLVLGNPGLTFDEALGAFARARHLWRASRPFDLTPHLETVARLFRIRLHAWDRVCWETRHFRYETVHAGTYGLPTDLSTLEGVLAELGLARSR
jgi:nucleoside-diphosphate-sugar epimerase